MLVDNDEDLERELQGLMGIVVGNIAHEILFYTKQSVFDVVYADPKNQPIMYERLGENGGFLGSWVAEPSKNSSSSEWIVFSDPEEMRYSPPQHGKDIYYEQIDDTVEIDRRDIMDAAIQEGTDWDYGTSKSKKDKDGNLIPVTPYWHEPRDYWGPIMDIINNQANFNEIVWDAFAEEGVQITAPLGRIPYRGSSMV